MSLLLNGILKDEKWMPKQRFIYLCQNIFININISAENTQSLWNHNIISEVEFFSMSKTDTVAEIKSWTVLTAHFLKLVNACIHSATAVVQILLKVSLHSQPGKLLIRWWRGKLAPWQKNASEPVYFWISMSAWTWGHSGNHNLQAVSPFGLYSYCTISPVTK